ncbi:MAG: adenylate kinase family protein [Candidatus Nanohaloarchaea archaeon]
MKIALTGTPGTGKTSVSELFDCRVIHITEFVKQRELGSEGDDFKVDVGAMVDELEEELDGESADVIIEGHLAHHFPADVCVVLRCEPSELKQRLSERDYSEEKIQENVESEALDVILSEAVARQEKIVEVDTTEKTVEETFEEVKKRVENEDAGYGDVDWSDYF